MSMIVDVLAIQKSDTTVPDTIAALAPDDVTTTYDVTLAIDGQRQTFCVAVFEHAIIQYADFIDDQARDVFRMHRVFPSKICQLVFDLYNNKLVELPKTLEESWE